MENYCKFVNFRENIIFANSVKNIFESLKIHKYDMIYISEGHSDLAISRGFYFRETSEFTVPIMQRVDTY